MTLAALRAAIRAAHLAPEARLLDALRASHAPDAGTRAAAAAAGARLVADLRAGAQPGLMEVFLAEYGLSTREGVALMCLAEALLRVPDTPTIDALIEDKIAPSEWSAHLGRSASPLVNASTWALMLTGKVLGEGEPVGSVLHRLVRRLGEPVIRAAVARALREMGRQFVLGETIDEALRRGAPRAAKGFTYSYDMLGEAAMTARDAAAYHAAYAGAIAALAPHASPGDVRASPGISVKLSALHPRYESAKSARVLDELVPRLRALARAAAAAGMGLNVDAEEADRLDLSLDVIEATLRDPDLPAWDGFGIVVQAYGKRAGPVIDWVHALAGDLGRRLMVRLVKGAYWDSEIKRAQTEGLPDFPVFTRKAATDVAWLCHARRLLGMTGRIYPQFATHNAHSVAAVLAMAPDRSAFEFQRLHGMGAALYDRVAAEAGTRCRIYAPVGAHRDLLAYLVRRLLENGANSSFVNQLLDPALAPEAVAADPFDALDRAGPNRAVVAPAALFAPRINSAGWELGTPAGLAAFAEARAPHLDASWEAAPMLAAAGDALPPRPVTNPADPADRVGQGTFAPPEAAAPALAAAQPWDAAPETRAAVLCRAADLYEANAGEFFALLAREAGKTAKDAVAELREAVDFLRYYAGAIPPGTPRGRIVCISPWNFPLAIFTGQVAAALATGNAVLAKPAETASLIAARATRLLHAAGVPRAALQLLPGEGRGVGAALVADPRVDGVLFTGSTATACAIDRAMAAMADPAAPLVAETGGINAMIVDSTALPEQAVRDILASAFQSAGQRCSALRMLYVQDAIAAPLLDLLQGAMDELALGDPRDPAADIGPVITREAAAAISAHIAQARGEGRLLKQVPAPAAGSFVGPALIRVGGIADIGGEVFGPVLHVATFRAEDLDAVVDAINAGGYGLTFALHSRIEDRIGRVLARLRVGNAYVNRNQIGAIVESQPFGGEGLSGTGPKAGGPFYLTRLVRPAPLPPPEPAPDAAEADPASVAALLAEAARRPVPLPETRDLPGPTGESNRLSLHARSPVLCLGPGAARAAAQAAEVRAAGGHPVTVAPGAAGPEALDGRLAPETLADLAPLAAVVCDGPPEGLRALRIALAGREGPRVPLIAEGDIAARLRLERAVSIDTTAAGGNATLLAASGP